MKRDKWDTYDLHNRVGGVPVVTSSGMSTPAKSGVSAAINQE
jgi:hypothetical protein